MYGMVLMAALGGVTEVPDVGDGVCCGAPAVSRPAAGAGPQRSAYYSPDSGDRDGDRTATLVVHLPADATLTIGGAPTHSTTDTRRFRTPPLEPGKAYYYVLRAEVDRRGEKMEASQNAVVRAGQQAEVYLEFPGANRPGKRPTP
jgi:uncharacterized protein (TIGR03000 family)